MAVREYCHGFAMSLAIANLSRIALYENAVTSRLFVVKFARIRLYRFHPVLATRVLLDTISSMLFASHCG
jgi:hypothetical protein